MHGFLAARLLSALHRRPVVYHCHDFVSQDSLPWSGGRLVSEFEHRYARTADLVIIPDAERAEVVARHLRLVRKPIVVANAPLAWPKAWGRELENRLLSACGTRWARVVFRQGVVGPGHGIERTIQSIPRWDSTEWGFVVMGACDPHYAEHLRSLASSLGVHSQLCILPAVGYDQVHQYTVGASIGHALYEPVHINNVYITTASNKLMEYMAAGLPVLVSDRPGLRAFVREYECGLTVDESSAESIAAGVNALLGDPDLARRLGAAGARAFEEELNYERQFEPALDKFRSLSHSLERS
ncbi:MAG: glycosyltransferase [Anaerolineae bacterium]